MFLFLLTSIDTWDCYYFESILNSQSGVAYKVVAYEKHVTLFCVLLTFYFAML